MKKDTDGLYYWTIDGEWLLDGEGYKVQASAKDGTNGDNGITPQLKIENEYWYVSYDSGSTWQMLGKATGDKGEDGQSLFSSVEVGTDTVTFILADGTAFTIPLNNSTNEDVHEWVDLGLPSGTLWATCNVGAKKPGEPGYYFAWGEFQPKEDYSWNTYWWRGDKLSIGNGYTWSLIKYCFNYGHNGFTDNLTELEPDNDAATVFWGEEWQMPSEEQLKELINNSYTKTDWRAQNDVPCLRITSLSNGNMISLPYAGYKYETNLYRSGSYWSRSLDLEDSHFASSLIFSASSLIIRREGRSGGMSVRPVRKK